MEIFIILLIIIVAYVVQRMLGKANVRFAGYIIPLLVTMYGTYATIWNLKVTFKFEFSVGSFISTVIMIVIYGLLIYSLYRVYHRAKEEAEYPYQALKDRGIL
ncbi:MULTISPECIES: hypothetical protein [unclassified Exiguobacterium]|uniref:hypothetical protein n=1 Tax=unclassified Exiguobacterium TaxID=2644629 RepID=UPI001BE6BEA0|nr:MULTISPECIES: hypothetical protein [unclassified Exiguobacterium]MDT0171620.1 hypothetical protein [Exiguobacterium sp. BRG2]